MKFIEKLIKSIIENKDMPKVQVEREISPLLEIFIEDIMTKSSVFKPNMDLGNYRFIAPEFPLQSQKLENNKTTNRSTNIDFLFINELTKDLYFVELKTDSSSFKYEQFEIYEDIINSIDITPQKLYEFLSESLTSDKYINLKEYLLSKMGYSKHSKENPFTIINDIKLVYIAPKKMMLRKWKGKNHEAINSIKDNHTIIYFEDMKKIKVAKYEDEWDDIVKDIWKLDEN